MIRELFPESVVTVEATETHWTGTLLPEEEAQIRSAGEKRRREFTAGRLCAREALERLGVRAFPLVSDADRVPRWPPGVVGSISHSASWCGVAVARADAALALGLDVERTGPLGAELEERVCRRAELARFARLPRPATADWPKLAFSAKEAAYKAYYPLARRRLDFHDLELEFDPEAGSFVARLVRDDAPSAAGRRAFAGRFALGECFVYTGVHLA